MSFICVDPNTGCGVQCQECPGESRVRATHRSDGGSAQDRRYRTAQH